METFYVTTPIYYVNDVPHIGHAYATVVADAMARWNRLMGHETMFLTGTDEHGLKIQRAAEANGLTPLEQADQTSSRFKEAWKGLDISNDRFIRTTEPEHHKVVQEFITRMKDNGYIEKGTYSGHYCVGCEAYYTEDDLVDGNCPTHERPAEWLEEDNYFFKLSAFEEPLKEWISSGAVQPAGKASEALGIVEQGLEDVSISRTSIDWGVKVPWDEEHVFYVWYDALINYVTGAGYGVDTEKFERLWANSHHVIGKDILRFHCVYWPAMLLAAGFEPPKQVNVTGFLLIGGKKLSKTGLTQIHPEDLVKDFGVDGYRYHFLRDVSIGADSEFSYEHMVERYNADLANTYGNLASRVVTLVGKKLDGVAPLPDPESPLAELAKQAYEKGSEGWTNFTPSIALDSIWHLLRETNAYLGETQPWKLDDGSPECAAILGSALEVLRIATILASPALVNSSQQIWEALGLDGSPADQDMPKAMEWGLYPGGAQLAQPKPVFPRIKAE